MSMQRQPLTLTYFWPRLGHAASVLDVSDDEENTIEVEVTHAIREEVMGFSLTWLDPLTPDGESPMFATIAEAVTYCHQNALAFAVSWAAKNNQLFADNGDGEGDDVDPHEVVATIALEPVETLIQTFAL